MAGDWIKMRVWLRRDPRVASMADYLAIQRRFMDWLSDPVRRTCDETAHEHVTSDVTRAITVSSLLEIWGVARERGDREDNDLVLKHCDLDNLDYICGTPCIGAALNFVDWAQEETKTYKGKQTQCVRFGNFFKDNEAPEDRYRKQHAEAQARYRAKSSDITSDITVTPREEKRREDINTSTRASRAPSSSRRKPQTQIPEDFVISPGVQKWADANGIGRLQAHLENFKFTCAAKGYAYSNHDAAFKRLSEATGRGLELSA